MNKQQKELIISQLHERFNDSPSSFLVGIKGLTVGQMQSLRSQLRQRGGELKVAKVRLIKRAVQDVSYGGEYMPFLREELGVVFVEGRESSAIAKVLSDFSKEHEALSLVAGYFERQVFDKAGVQHIATLPSRDVLLARLCGSLKMPVTKLVCVLDAYVKKISASSAGPIEEV